MHGSHFFGLYKALLQCTKAIAPLLTSNLSSPRLLYKCALEKGSYVLQMTSWLLWDINFALSSSLYPENSSRTTEYLRSSGTLCTRQDWTGVWSYIFNDKIDLIAVANDFVSKNSSRWSIFGIVFFVCNWATTFHTWYIYSHKIMCQKVPQTKKGSTALTYIYKQSTFQFKLYMSVNSFTTSWTSLFKDGFGLTLLLVSGTVYSAATGT